MGGPLSWLAVGVGAAIGAWLRWGLALWLSDLHAHVQVGTLTANLAGGYLIGIALAFFSSHPGLSPEWRLFAITGFLGGLTTFSSFSGEAMMLLQRGQYGWALGHSALHLLGSIGFCIAGYATYRAVSQ
ncbi:fluoride efflux transporter CrcB [Massilia solisilvae]|uniref:Fluoride-specific ion channel FluC n=1 Tax=Massilia solisilvae TaxID=1811225 RepID=A0ABT2BGM4_9BURK|nr:fluoride efflux transporter CrcB [Massilia solisilvae]MCS0607595.1 fluoride efflux transporter CrcB [Massilia solisilvae]